MSGVGTAARLVFRDPFNLALGLVAALGCAVLLCWSGQVVTRAPLGGLYWDLETQRLVALLALTSALALLDLGRSCTLHAGPRPPAPTAIGARGI